MVDLNLFLGSNVVMYDPTPNGPDPTLPYFGSIPQDLLDAESEWVKSQMASSVELVLNCLILNTCLIVMRLYSKD